MCSITVKSFRKPFTLSSLLFLDTIQITFRYRFDYFTGNTLLERVCIRLTRYLHNHDMTYVMNMKEVFLHVIKCYSLSYDIFNANMTLFEITIHHNPSVSLS